VGGALVLALVAGALVAQLTRPNDRPDPAPVGDPTTTTASMAVDPQPDFRYGATVAWDVALPSVVVAHAPGFDFQGLRLAGPVILVEATNYDRGRQGIVALDATTGGYLWQDLEHDWDTYEYLECANGLVDGKVACSYPLDSGLTLYDPVSGLPDSTDPGSIYRVMAREGEALYGGDFNLVVKLDARGQVIWRTGDGTLTWDSATPCAMGNSVQPAIEIFEQAIVFRQGTYQWLLSPRDGSVLARVCGNLSMGPDGTVTVALNQIQGYEVPSYAPPSYRGADGVDHAITVLSWDESTAPLP
jgi:hypothetical protein